MKHFVLTFIFVVGMNGALLFVFSAVPVGIDGVPLAANDPTNQTAQKAANAAIRPYKPKTMTDPYPNKPGNPEKTTMQSTRSIHGFTVPALEGGEIDFGDFKGRKILVVNTASECGYTPQYKLLEELYKAKEDDLVIVGFPANDFGKQEPGTNADIADFCKKNYGVTFPMAGKVVVKGEGQHALFQWLTSQDNPDFMGEIQWNFEKFLLDGNGHLVRRFRSAATPMDEDFLSAIEGR